LLTFAAPRGLRQWAEIYRLYQKAFPGSEKKPFWMILKMYRKGNSHVWRFARNGSFAGLIITINGEDHILLDYLAVEESQRGTGIGTEILQLMRHSMPEKVCFWKLKVSMRIVTIKRRESAESIFTKNAACPAWTFLSGCLV